MLSWADLGLARFLFNCLLSAFRDIVSEMLRKRNRKGKWKVGVST